MYQFDKSIRSYRKNVSYLKKRDDPVFSLELIVVVVVLLLLQQGLIFSQRI